MDMLSHCVKMPSESAPSFTPESINSVSLATISSLSAIASEFCEDEAW